MVGPTGDTWEVDVELDTDDFNKWLETIEVLDRVSFTAKLPNPDAESSFQFIEDHLRDQQASQFTHSLTPRDPEVRLNKDFTGNTISFGLMEMARRSYAAIRARGRTRARQVRKYNQGERARKEIIQSPSSKDETLNRIVELAAGLREESGRAA
jgi:hypothetical protein